ncbi:MAG: NlpC/P60 family protein [Polaribacter sp.]
MKFLNYFLFLFLVVFISCKNNTNSIAVLEHIHRHLKTIYAPDKRVDLFDIQFDIKNNEVILKGETTNKKAFHILLDSLKKREVNYVNKVRILPDSVVADTMFAVARNSVINIRSKPSHSSELGTQGLLGMSLKVLDKKGDFYRVQTPDNYISWVDKGGITRMNKDDFDAWNQSKKIIFTENVGVVYADKNENATIVSDISLGGLLKYISETTSYYKVEYPDNRIGFVKKEEATLYNSWLKNTMTTQENIETLARKFEGFPYLWGGTSSKGMDCSGFTKMVYLMNGFVIPRDASQQIKAGKIVDKSLDFKDLQKGDLLFFGKKATETQKQRIVHVAIWLGNNKKEFMHASGNVHINSMDSNQPNYDEFNKNRYLGSRRYLGIKDELIVDLKEVLKY